jgi:uncharacterized GH25 family protein
MHKKTQTLCDDSQLRHLTLGNFLMYRYALLGLFLSAISPAWAHDYWLKADGAGGAVLIYGHADDSEAYQAEVIKAVAGWALDGTKREVAKAFAKGQLRLTGSGVSTWAVEVDNGYWTKTVKGWKNVSKRQQPKNIKSTWDRHFAKMVDAKNAAQAAGHPLEIILTSASATRLEGKVLLRGKPAAGVEVEQNHKTLVTTDQNGVFKVKGKGKGRLVLSARKQEALQGNADADFLNLDATISVQIP